MFRNYVISNCFEPLFVILAKFGCDTGITMSVSTGSRYIKRLRMSSNIAVQKPFKTPRHLLARLNWARKHKECTTEQWDNVLFTDESTFTERPTNNRLRVWRRQGDRWKQRCTVPTFKSGYQSVIVWAGFSKYGRTSLVGITGYFNQHADRSIIDAHILPCKRDIHRDSALFTLQEDNCGPHRAKSIATYLYSKSINRMQWPSESPDLDSIENMWGIMKQKLRNQTVFPSNPNELFSILSHIWHNMPDSYFYNLVSSMPARVKMVKENIGGSTKY